MYSNAIRALSLDAIARAKSGHPGAPLGMADMGQVLARAHLKVDPAHPNWINRDRWVLSNGHAAMFQYALLHLMGFDVSLEDLKQFRQLHAPASGHPEVGELPGVDTTTGPLGQGLANAVGMALAEKQLAEKYNRPDFAVIDHWTYAFVGDGCLMEGVGSEASALAGTWGLGRLIVLWDDNGISIDGQIQPWCADDIPSKFEAMNWHVIRDVDGHDPKAIDAALSQAKSHLEQPTLICARTVIGFGVPEKAGTEKVHGSPILSELLEQTKTALNWTHAPFEIPQAIYEAFNQVHAGEKAYQQWSQTMLAYEQQHPELAQAFKQQVTLDLPENFDQQIQKHQQDFCQNPMARSTRQASQDVLKLLGASVPGLIGGSADLTTSTLTQVDQVPYIHYGVREFGMSAIMNGLALYGAYRPYGATFLTFADYMKNGIRMSALMQLPVTYVLTHDSIALGEDGPTHQPIEQLVMLRATPQLSVWRPADRVETLIAWQQAIKQPGPTALILSRQTLPVLPQTDNTSAQIHRGAYVLSHQDKTAAIRLLATGSEVGLALSVQAALVAKGLSVAVVSMPCWEVFQTQSLSYQQRILPDTDTLRVSIEAASTMGWHRWLRPNDLCLGIDEFGLSAPAEDVLNHFEFSVSAIVEKIQAKYSEEKRNAD